MTTRDWLRTELREELSTPFRDEPEASWLEGGLAAALADIGPSDRSIELLMELGEASDQAAGVYESTVFAEVPPMAFRRDALGISAADAARQLGVSQAIFDALEQTPLRWMNLDVARVAQYLARLGVSPAVFVRWQASSRPSGPHFAWGYRPGAVAERPMEDADAGEYERLLDWGRMLLAIEAHVEERGDERELFGHRWSTSAAAERAKEIADEARARILRTPLRYDVHLEATHNLIALASNEGMAYPAFQFDDAGRSYAIVEEVNSILGAAADPWGVAEWWLADDAFLGARPVDIIGSGPAADERLRAAAQRLLESE